MRGESGYLATKVTDRKGGHDPALRVHVPAKLGRHLQDGYGHDGAIGRIDQVRERAQCDRSTCAYEHILLYIRDESTTSLSSHLTSLHFIFCLLLFYLVAINHENNVLEIETVIEWR